MKKEQPNKLIWKICFGVAVFYVIAVIMAYMNLKK